MSDDPSRMIRHVGSADLALMLVALLTQSLPNDRYGRFRYLSTPQLGDAVSAPECQSCRYMRDGGPSSVLTVSDIQGGSQAYLLIYNSHLCSSLETAKVRLETFTHHAHLDSLLTSRCFDPRAIRRCVRAKQPFHRLQGIRLFIPNP